MGEPTQELTDRQRLFIAEMGKPGMTATRAAELAGYSKKSAYAQANRLQKLPHVAAALQAQRAVIVRRIELTAEEIDRFVMQICQDDMCETRDRLKAAEMLYRRLGAYGEARRREPEEDMSLEDLEAAARAELGL